jgi:glycosyltransferase involved in cell wall biosynthesis
MLSTSKISAVIPFFNERKTIKEVITRTLPFVDRVFAINDGSTDGGEFEVPDDPRVLLVNLSHNTGKGAAINHGFNLSFTEGYDFTVTLDADLQHPPELIPQLLNVRSDDIIIGNRLNDMSSMPLQRKMSNSITSFLLSKKTRQNIIDSQCGFRVYRTAILPNILPDFPGFEAESEILINAARHNYRIGFREIPTIYGDEESKMKPMQAIKGFIKVMFL